MTLIEEIKNAAESKKLPLMTGLTEDCKLTQERVLQEILVMAKDTEIGRKYEFSKIHSVKDFQEKMPLSDYSDYSKEIKKMASGQENILFPGKPSYFLSSSGSTGMPKMIPESPLSSLAKNVALELRGNYMISAIMEHPKFPDWAARHGLHPDMLKQKDAMKNEFFKHYRFFSMASSTSHKKTSGGISIDFASGKSLANSGVTSSLAYPIAIQSLHDGEAVNYLTMLFALRTKDVLMVVGNDAARFKVRVQYAKEHAQALINDMRNGTISKELNLTAEERQFISPLFEANPQRADKLQQLFNSGADHFIPKYYWPDLMVCSFWLSGSLGISIQDIKCLVPEDVVYFDIGYGASEAKLNIPYRPNAKDGILATALAFFEFQDINSGTIHTADDIKVNHEYEIIITTFGGLYRYRLHDVIRVNDFFKDTPVIEFVAKSEEILNVSQEKLPSYVVITHFKEFLCKNGYSVKHAQIYPDFQTKCYEIYFETDMDVTFTSSELIALADKFNESLGKSIELYHRMQNFHYMTPLKLFAMRSGWQNYLRKQKLSQGVADAQIKIPVLIYSRPDQAYLQTDAQST